jgi:hypothetical protein
VVLDERRAVALRDIALALLSRLGTVSKGIVSYTGDGFILVQRTRFDNLSTVSEPTAREKNEAALRGQPPPIAFHDGLDILWRGVEGDEPVLTMNWNDASLKVWRYRPGPWEAELERLCRE